MIYSIGDKVRINSRIGWGGRFHKCSGVITSLEPDNKFRVEVVSSEVPFTSDVHHWGGDHSLLCSPSNVLRVVG